MDERQFALQFISNTGPFTVTHDNQPVPPIFDFGNFYKYNLQIGCWDIVDDYTVGAHMQMVVERGVNQGLVSVATDHEFEAAKRLARQRLWAARPNFFETAPKGLAFKNGFLLLNENNLGELRSHAPENRARFRVEYDYQETPTPKWDLLLNKIFTNDADIEDRIALIHEFVGATLLGLAPRFGKCIVLFGDGSNGKSSLQAVIRALFHSQLIVTSNPQTWNREYDRAELRGKRLNVTSELPEREMMESEAFKAIVEGHQIGARMIREKPFLFYPEAGHLFAANGLMRTSDYSHGFFRRFIVIPFNNIFTGNEDVVTPILKEELGGIAFKSVHAVEKAIANGHKYTVPLSSSLAIDEWKSSANPVAQFVQTCLEETATYSTTATEVWNVWRAWCKETGHTETNMTNFCRRLKQAIGAGSAKRYKDCVRYCYAISPEGQRFASLYPRAIS